ncbi:MAG: hypothetical protein ACFNS9_05290, partial [Actinomyces sp.]
SWEGAGRDWARAGRRAPWHWSEKTTTTAKGQKMNRLLSVLKEGWAEVRRDLRRTRDDQNLSVSGSLEEADRELRRAWAVLVLTVIGDEVIHR